MLNTTTIENIFQYFYCKKYGNKAVPSRTETTKKLCVSFISLIDKQYSIHGIGKTFMWEYFLFQFNYWDELKLSNKFSEKISISYIVGRKAFLRYVERDKTFDWRIESYNIVCDLKLLKSDLDPFFDPVKYKMVDRSDDLRKLYYNTDRGFATCIEFTTLYEPAKSICILCKFKTECKELKRVNY